MKTVTINANGIEQIARALGQHHKFGRRYFTLSMLAAWAGDAERNFAQGNDCSIEIRGADARLGAPVVVTITPEGYELQEMSAH